MVEKEIATEFYFGMSNCRSRMAGAGRTLTLSDARVIDIRKMLVRTHLG